MARPRQRHRHASASLILLPLVLLIRLSLGDAITITIENNCNYTIWPVVGTTSGTSSTNSYSLLSGDSTTINQSQSWTGRIWGRTVCSNDSLTGNFSCQTGDCGTGRFDCQGHLNTPPATLIEFSNQVINQQVFYDVSLVDGYNIPVALTPQDSGNESNSCGVTGCVFNMKDECPSEFRVIQDQSVIGCKSPCNVFQTDEFCCNDPSSGCNNFSLGALIFKKTCPRAYSYALDDDTATFSCTGNRYIVTFCPPTKLASLVSQPLGLASPTPSASPTSSTLQAESPMPSALLPVSNSTRDSKNKHKKLIYLIFGLSILATTLVLIFFGVCRYLRKKKKNIRSSTNLEVTQIKKDVLDSLEYNLDTIRLATGNFATHNKLGEGGFGEVYKGRLENEQDIAVKRLSKNSGQGVVEFKTEVNLVAKLRHKNLVKLLGFCVTMEEKLLVYEFLPNSSLDKLLSDQTRQASFNWKQRFNVIIGIARGLLYLHEDSPLKVIHRDLKSSNILIDENMNPKISDFGLARLFGVDQTQGDTKRIVGTYGYMAPEYAITGHYSVKSDVYSFGVIVLEVVSGQRNKVFGYMQCEEALLHRAWRLWNENMALDLVDTTLEDNFTREEVIKCIQLGLLCIQEDASMRPRMSSIVATLNGQNITLALPKPPNFFGTAATNYEDNVAQENFINVYTGTKTITELYPRD